MLFEFEFEFKILISNFILAWFSLRPLKCPEFRICYYMYKSQMWHLRQITSSVLNNCMCMF